MDVGTRKVSAQGGCWEIMFLYENVGHRNRKHFMKKEPLSCFPELSSLFYAAQPDKIFSLFPKLNVS